MWAVFALLTSFFNAAYFLLNQKMAMKASLFMVYRGWAVFFMLLPFAGLFTPVPHWEFYALCTLQGALIAFVDGKFFVALRRLVASRLICSGPLTRSMLATSPTGI